MKSTTLPASLCFTLTISFCISFLSSCENHVIKEQPPTGHFEEIELVNAWWSTDLPIPEGSKAIFKDQQMEIVYPEGVKLVQYIAATNSIRSSGSSTVTCIAAADCSKGCEPHLMTIGGGMTIPSCSPCDPSGTCTMSTSDQLSEPDQEIASPIEADFPSFFIDKRIGLQRVDSKTFQSLPTAPDELFQLPEAQKAYQSFFSQNGFIDFSPSLAAKDPNGFGYARMNVLGFKLLLIVPRTLADIPFSQAQHQLMEAVSCHCNAGDGCTLTDVYSGGLVKIKIGLKCERDGCNSCSMTVK